MAEYIKRKDALEFPFANGIYDHEHANEHFISGCESYREWLEQIPAANVVELPETGIGDLSDGFHTFNGLYEQRMILFAALVKAYKDRAWKSYRHEDGEYCFGGGWFIVGIDTPEGSYTYHYENKYWEMFDCIDIPRAKHWDGHTEKDAETRLMSLPNVVEREVGKWINYLEDGFVECPFCKSATNCDGDIAELHYCFNCGAKLYGDEDA